MATVKGSKKLTFQGLEQNKGLCVVYGLKQRKGSYAFSGNVATGLDLLKAFADTVRIKGADLEDDYGN